MFMRLGEFKTKTREFDGRQIIYLSDYTDGTVKELEIDIVTKDAVYLRTI